MSVPPSIPPQQEQELRKLQELYTQVQAFRTQISQLEVEIAEIQNALDETKDLPENTPVFRSVGNLLFRVPVKSTVEKLEEDLGRKKAMLESLKKREAQLTSQMESLQQKLSKSLGA